MTLPRPAPSSDPHNPAPGGQPPAAHDSPMAHATHAELSESPLSAKPSEPPAPTGPLICHRSGLWLYWIDEAVARTSGQHQEEEIDSIVQRALTDPACIQRTFKSDRRSIVQLAELDGRLWVLKRYRMFPLKMLLAHAFRLSPAWRELRGAALLHNAGLRAGRPLALFHHPTGQGLLLPYIPGISLHGLLFEHHRLEACDESMRQKRLAMAAAVGRQIHRLASTGLMNRDHKLSNLIADEAALHHGADPIIIDPVGVRPRPRPRKGGANASAIRQMLRILHRSLLVSGPIARAEGRACLKAARGETE